MKNSGSFYVQALLLVQLCMHTAIFGFTAMLCTSPATHSAIVKNASNPKALDSSMKWFLTLILFTTITYITEQTILIFQLRKYILTIFKISKINIPLI